MMIKTESVNETPFSIVIDYRYENGVSFFYKFA